MCRQDWGQYKYEIKFHHMEENDLTTACHVGESALRRRPCNLTIREWVDKVQTTLSHKLGSLKIMDYFNMLAFQVNGTFSICERHDPTWNPFPCQEQQQTIKWPGIHIWFSTNAGHCCTEGRREGRNNCQSGGQQGKAFSLDSSRSFLQVLCYINVPNQSQQ